MVQTVPLPVAGSVAVFGMTAADDAACGRPAAPRPISGQTRETSTCTWGLSVSACATTMPRCRSSRPRASSAPSTVSRACALDGDFVPSGHVSNTSAVSDCIYIGLRGCRES